MLSLEATLMSLVELFLAVSCGFRTFSKNLKLRHSSNQIPQRLHILHPHQRIQGKSRHTI